MIANMHDKYCIHIKFEKGSKNPQRIFEATTNLLNTFESIDIILARSIDFDIKTSLTLDSIQEGSLKTWVYNVMKDIPDDIIKNLEMKKIIGLFLLKTKYKLMDWLRDKEKMPSIEDIKKLQKFINKEIEIATINEMRTTPISLQEIVNIIYDITNSTTPLNSKDEAVFELENKKNVIINRSFTLSKEERDNFLIKTTRTTQVKMALKIKKPDYLGSSKWDLRTNDETVSARIEDLSWLNSFQKREIDIRPGDSMIANVQAKVQYGYENEIISKEYTVKKVISITQTSLPKQGSLF